MVIEVMMQKYLQAQSLVWVFVVVGILQNIISILVAAFFIYVADVVIVWVKSMLLAIAWKISS